MESKSDENWDVHEIFFMRGTVHIEYDLAPVMF